MPAPTPPVPPSSAAAAPHLTELRERLAQLTIRDEHLLRRRLDALGGRRHPPRPDALADVAAAVDEAARRVERRRAALPEVAYPASLPVSQRRDDIVAALREHQVVVVAGETGSGKTTQLPKMCLETGRGIRGTVGHTQPRRLAARAVAERLAEELDVPLGGAVGYSVRFTDEVSEDTLVKVMTDGILLAELRSDRMLRRYDTLIIDEAHERSLNIDFLLGYLKDLLPRRPDLSVVITSATIETGRFSAHFGDAPVIEVSGRTYPVELRYRPLVDEGGPAGDEDADEGDGGSSSDARDQTQGILDAVAELCGEGPGDVLVFLSGEREIRDTADALKGAVPPGTEILPLYARLSAAEQHRVFASHPGRRIVLATNVAETSLTVPGIRYVVDPGTARVSRYSHRLKVQRLPIERISQASANQRKGRCGRVAEGVCIRLYSEEDFLSRPEFTEPEILRTNLASVILQMTALGLGDIAAFPFVDPPDRRNVRDGVQLLEELGALDPAQKDPRKRLTPLGRSLSQLPIDPRLGRMVLEADRNGCVREVLVIAAALSIQDPRERPADRQQAAAEKHARFADKESDFLSYLNLWDYLQEKQQELSSSAFRRLCKAEFLHYLRVREWQDLVSQLRRVARSLGINPAPASGEVDAQRVHQSLLAGLLSHVGLRDPEKRDYLGARGARFALFPGSSLFKKPPRWVMSAELVETSRLWARVNARIDPEWIEPLAGHLVKRTYSEPHWEKKQGAVMAYEKVLLYGIPIVVSRKVGYARVDPAVSRELFLRHALVEGDWQTHHRFFHDNRRLLEDVEELEHRVRRRDIVVDDETLFDFYDERVPADVVSGRHFDSWWKKERRLRPDLLDFDRSMLVAPGSGQVAEEDYPDEWVVGDLRLRVTYQFDPGSATDGVTLHVPLAVLNQLDDTALTWQVPGLRHELATALVRSLPKALRVHLVPAPDVARAAVDGLQPVEGTPFPVALAERLRVARGVDVPPDAWDRTKVPAHLQVTVRVHDDRGRTVAEGKDLAELRRRTAPRVRTAVAAAAPSVERSGLRSWDGLGSLPRTLERPVGGQVVRGYPALVDEDAAVAVRVLPTPDEQRRAMARGTRRLLRLQVPAPLRTVSSTLGNESKLVLAANPHGSVGALLEDCVDAVVDDVVERHGGPAWDEQGFAALVGRLRAEQEPALSEVVRDVERVLTVARRVDRLLRSTSSLPLLPTLQDVRAQTDALVRPGFVTAAGRRRLRDLERYLQAAEIRLTRALEAPARDQALMGRLRPVVEEYDATLERLPPALRDEPAAQELRWMLEELRVGLFAQTLRTAYPVSEKRVLKALDELEGR